ncbi:MAG: hypothetical protein CMC43_06680 [Flavobacteriaceae bacterium]|nr:hypothetical protein [Flavobacteriaceae bacterium]
MSFGWAYVDCDGTGGGQAAGPTGSLQFLTGANATSGSARLMYYTASYGEHTPNSLVLSGNLIVTGTVSASIFKYEDISIIDATGSTNFGNSNDDVHTRIGSLLVKTAGASGVNVLSASMATQAVHVQGLNVLYETCSIDSYTASAPGYILGVQQTGQVEILIPSASIYGSGSILLVKDEVGHIDGTNITINAATGYSIDGSLTYSLTGSNPAISLYSNGANWFVF